MARRLVINKIMYAPPRTLVPLEHDVEQNLAAMPGQTTFI